VILENYMEINIESYLFDEENNYKSLKGACIRDMSDINNHRG